MRCISTGTVFKLYAFPQGIVYHDESLPLLLSLFKWDANLVHCYQLAKLAALTLKYESSMLHINRKRLSHPQQNNTLLWSPVFNELAPTITRNFSICRTNAAPITFPCLPGIKIVHCVLYSSLSLSLCAIAIKHPWCEPHRALTLLCSALITLQHRACQSRHWSVGEPLPH